jgi:hypothetical protein
MRRPSSLALALFVGGCINFTSNAVSVNYDLEPQEYLRDFGAGMGTLPVIDCSVGGDMVCAQAMAPPGAVVTCDMTSKQCVARYDLLLMQTVNLSQQKGFPSSVANSSAVKGVTVGAVHYWIPSNTLNFPTPTMDVWVGSQSVQKETDPGALKLGTVPSLPAGQVTACRSGSPGKQDSYCDMPILPDGQAGLAMLAKDYKVPFNVLVVSHVAVKGGDPVPSGKLDLYLQPAVAFEVIPF